MMKQIEALLGIDDIMRIFGLSRVSIYRKVGEARAGKCEFPLPIWGSKQKLRWNAADIEQYIQASNGIDINSKNNTKQEELL